MLSVVAVVLPVVMLGGVVYLFGKTHSAKQVAGRYLTLVRDGQFDRAYSMLAPDLQQRLPRDELESSLGTPVLRDVVGVRWIREDAPTVGYGCVKAVVRLASGGSETLRVYVRDAKKGFLVHEVHVGPDRPDIVSPAKCD